RSAAILSAMKALRRSTLLWCSLVMFGCGSPTESTAPIEVVTTVAKGNDNEVDDQTRIHGRLLGHDGQPISLAEVHATVSGQPPIDVAVAADGSFALELPVPGWTRLRLTGVNHEEHTLAFLADKGEHELSARLGTYERPESYESVAGLGRFDGKGGRVNLSFTRRDDGTWAARVEKGEAGAKAKEF